jgi:pimeloyl-ACP methyl ester carboxylesterase
VRSSLPGTDPPQKRRAALAAVLLAAAAVRGVAETDPLSRWTVVDGRTIHYLEKGDPSAPAILMVHGWCGSAEDFRGVISALPDGVRAVAPDLPGCGRSEKPVAAYDLPFFLAFLRSFSDTLGLGRFTLVGHSMGGHFSVHFTDRWPESVERLFLIAPYGLKGEEGAYLALARMGPLVDLCFLLNNRLFIRWASAANLFYKPTPELLDATVEATAQSILGCESARAIASITRNVIGRDHVDDMLPRIDKETLVLWGDHDKVLAPLWGPRFEALLPRVTLVIVPDAGHMLMTEKPLETADLISRFVGSSP